MELSAEFARRQLERIKPISSAISLEGLRRGQDVLGTILAKTMRKNVDINDFKLSNSDACLIHPRDELKKGVVLYLHGGGYTCGDIEYAKGFGSVLAADLGIKVMCVAYRLAPEFPYPTCIDDALEGYRMLLNNGYLPSQIVFCGESAGGGLCYALCLKAKQLRLPLPACIIAISPWTDLTFSGKSHDFNRDNDPSLTREALLFHAKSYLNCEVCEIFEKAKNAFVSPIFADLTDLPPSLIFVGGDEILLDDSRNLHAALIKCGCESQLVVADHMWHAYPLYCIRERKCDIDSMNDFLDDKLMHERKLRWMRLDNAAKIYPAAKRRRWNNFFRLSATLSEPIDRDILKTALDVTVRRFPSIAVRLCKGVFWYYLEELSSPPEITDEACWPLAHAPFETINSCALRVIVYGSRLAVEFYHALTDGTGGMIFLKTLLAEYLEQRYGVVIPNECGVLDRLEVPHEDEFEDSFLKNRGECSAGRRKSTAFKIKYTTEPDDFRHLTTMMFDVTEALTVSKKFNATLTEFVAAAMLMALQRIQDTQIPNKNKQKPIRVVIPVNLRKLFKSITLRNFADVVMPEIDPRMGDYDFDEIIKAVKHQLGFEVTAKRMQARFTPNANAERSMLLRVAPLFAKNIVMKAIYNSVGERTSCLNISNLGKIEVPDVMHQYVTRFDFILGVQATKPNNCGMLSYNGTVYMNFIRNTVESCLELEFYKVLRENGLHVCVESNGSRQQ